MALLRAARFPALITACIVAYAVFAAYGALAQPVAQFKKPSEGAVISDQIYIEVAFDSKSTQPVTRIKLYVDEKPAFSYDLKNPVGYGRQVFKWNTRQLANGPHILMAKVYDASGRECHSPPRVRVYVDNGRGGPGPDVPTPARLDEIPPTVRITSPANGATVHGKIEIGVEATDQQGIKFVFVYIDDQFKAVTNRPPYRFEQDTTSLGNGLHVITAAALDPNENRGESSKVYVKVDNPRYATAARPTPPSLRPPTTPRPGIAPTVPAPPSPAGEETRVTGTPDRRSVASPSLTRVALLPGVDHATGFGVRAVRPSATARPAATRPVIGPPLTTAVSVHQPPMTSSVREVALAPARAVGTKVRATPPSGAEPHFPLAPPAASKGSPGAAPLQAAGLRVPQPQPIVSVAKATPPGTAPTEARSPATTPSEARRDAVPSPDAMLAKLPTVVTTSGPRATAPSVALPAQRPAAPPVGPVATSAPATDKAAAYAALPRTSAAEGPPRDALPATQPRSSRPELKRVEHIVHLAGKQFKVVFDDAELKLRTSPTSRRGVAVGPIRELFEHAGGQVHWYAVEKRVWAATDHTEVELKIGDPNVKLNNERVVLRLAPFIKHGRTMVPFGFLERALNVTVMYEPDTDRILITSNAL